MKYSEEPGATAVGIAHRDDSSLFARNEQDALILVEVADLYLNNNKKPSHFHAYPFVATGRGLLKKLKPVHHFLGQECVFIFDAFWDTKVAQTKSLLLNIRVMLINTMKQTSYEAQEVRGVCCSRAKARSLRVFVRLSKHLFTDAAGTKTKDLLGNEGPKDLSKRISERRRQLIVSVDAENEDADDVQPINKKRR